MISNKRGNDDNESFSTNQDKSFSTEARSKLSSCESSFFSRNSTSSLFGKKKIRHSEFFQSPFSFTQDFSIGTKSSKYYNRKEVKKNNNILGFFFSHEFFIDDNKNKEELSINFHLII